MIGQTLYNPELIFLGTGGAWGLPELNCPCAICREMRSKGERRQRTALLIKGKYNLLIDCGPDIHSQLENNNIDKIDAVLITHEHGDHYIGLDELFVFKRNRPEGEFIPIPVYMTSQAWNVVKQRFGYLEDFNVIKVMVVAPGQWINVGPYEIFPFKTNHGDFAKGAVGYFIRCQEGKQDISLLYTSDFKDIPDIPSDLSGPDYLVIQSFWFNEPVYNRPYHMSFQNAIGFIQRFSPKNETFIVHMGDADKVPGDPANNMLKKYEPRDPLRPPGSSEPYPVPLNHSQWQDLVSRIMTDRGLPYQIRVPHDGLVVPLNQARQR